MAQMAAMLNDIGNGTSDRVLKSMDANRYATKKTIAQGMLDIALLTANASQLKYILQVGHKHEFYTLMLTLISISIILQMSVGILFVVIGGLNINRRKDQRAAIIINDIILVAIFVISLVNVTAAILAVVMSLIDLEKGPRQREIANTLNHISLAFVLIALSCDVIKMNFGLDPALLQCIVCVFLGRFDINKEENHKSANLGQNLSLVINGVSVTVNILINSSLDLKMYDNNNNLVDQMIKNT